MHRTESNSPGSGRAACTWARLEACALASQLPELGTNNTCLLFSADGQSLFAGTQSGEVQVWSVPRRQLLGPLPGSAEPVRRLRQDAQGRLLVVGQWKSDVQAGFPCRIGVWNVADWQEQKSWMVPGHWARVCGLSRWPLVSHGPAAMAPFNCGTSQAGPRPTLSPLLRERYRRCLLTGRAAPGRVQSRRHGQGLGDVHAPRTGRIPGSSSCGLDA